MNVRNGPTTLIPSWAETKLLLLERLQETRTPTALDVDVSGANLDALKFATLAHAIGVGKSTEPLTSWALQQTMVVSQFPLWSNHTVSTIFSPWYRKTGGRRTYREPCKRRNHHRRLHCCSSMESRRFRRSCTGGCEARPASQAWRAWRACQEPRGQRQQLGEWRGWKRVACWLM